MITVLLILSYLVCRAIIHILCTAAFTVHNISRSTPVAQSAPRNLLTRWDVSSIPANGIFLTKNKKKNIYINAQRVEND